MTATGSADLGGEERTERADVIANEFSAVQVRKVFTRNGERLEISAPRLGHTVRLDALQLEALTWQQPEFFSQLLETPFGPTGEGQ